MLNRTRLVGLMLLFSGVGCGRVAYLCAGEGECGTQFDCVSGRCLRRGSVAAIDTARRWVVEPIEVAYIRQGDESSSHNAETAAMGKMAAPSAVLLRFPLGLPLSVDVLEAYVLLDQAVDFEADPIPIEVHAQVITSAWTASSISWHGRPHVEDANTPWSRAQPSGPRTVRIDVTRVLRNWSRGPRDSFDAAVEARGKSSTGVAFALASGRHGRGPRLELYVK